MTYSTDIELDYFPQNLKFIFVTELILSYMVAYDLLIRLDD